MNSLIHTLEIVNKLQQSISGYCKVFICTNSQQSIKFIFDWAEGFRLSHIVDIVELSSREEELLVEYLIDKCNGCYADEIEKRRMQK